MRTLHVDTGREMRGGQWQARYLIERLEGATLLAPSGSPLLEDCPVDCWPLSFNMLFRLSRDVDLVHVHDARAHTFAVLARGAPLIVSRRVAFPVKKGFASRWKYSRPSRYLAVSKFVANRLMEAGVAEDKIRVVYDGVPIPRPSTAERKQIVALAGKGTEIVSAAAKTLGVPIHFTSNLSQDLSSASIFIYVSELEGLGSAALAAMAAGVPVIASRVGGLPEIVEHETTGLLIENQELAPALRRLLDDPVAAAEMGRRGRERVEQKFSVEAMVQATERVYQEVLGC